MSRPLVDRPSEGRTHVQAVPIWLPWVPWVAVGATVIAQLVRAWDTGPMVSDWALGALRALDVGTSNTPFVGAWSRYGWSHPGPMLFIALALPVRLLGSFAGSIAVALAVNTASLIAIGRITQRRGQLEFALAGLVVTGLLNVQAWTSVDPWNASLVILPLTAFLVALLGSLERTPRCGTTMLIAGTWCAQAHIGCVPIVVVGALAIAGARHSELRRALRAHRWAVVAAGAAWVLPLLQPGNVIAMVEYVVSPPADGALGGRDALTLVAQIGGLHLPWVGAHDVLATNTIVQLGWLDVPLVPLGVLGLAALRRHRPDVVLAALWIVQVLALSGVRGPAYEWLSWPTAVLTAASTWWLLVAATRLLAERAAPSARDTRTIAAVISVGALAFVSATIVQRIGAEPWWRQDVTAAFVLPVTTAIEHAEPGELAVWVDTREEVSSQALPAVVERLVRAGRTVVTNPEWSIQYGEHRSWICGQRYDAFTFFDADRVTGPPAGVSSSTGWTLSTEFDQLTPVQRTEVTRLRPAVEELLVERRVPERIALLSTIYGGAVGLGLPHLSAVDAAAITRLAELYAMGTAMQVWRNPSWIATCTDESW